MEIKLYLPQLNETINRISIHYFHELYMINNVILNTQTEADIVVNICGEIKNDVVCVCQC